MTVYILGGGPAGLAIADGLSDFQGESFVCIEKDGCLGGLAKTIDWEGVGRHDLGPHKIFTTDQNLSDRVHDLLANDGWKTQEKKSSIYLHGHYLPYPPSPFSLAKVFGFAEFVKMTVGYGIARLKSLASSANEATFESDLIRRVGAPLYGNLFKPIALKLWGEPSDLDAKLSQGRVQTPSVLEIVATLLGRRKTSEFEALTFDYPVGGLQKIWQAIEAKSELAGRYLTSHSVCAIESDGRRIVGIDCVDNISGKRETLFVGAADYVVSTLPLGLMCKLLGSSLPTAVVDLVEETVSLNDLILVFLHVAEAKLLDESWIFVPDPDIAFHRVSEQASFDEGMTPEGSIVCCEIMSSDLRRKMTESDESLVAEAKQGLREMGYGNAEFLNARVVRLPRSYPVFRPGYQTKLDIVLKDLDVFDNFRTLGRQGAFNYIGTLDAMDIGYGFVRWYREQNSQSWAVERERTNHYPVLD